MTTLGKYLGGGASFGAFGGRRDIMQRLDPARPDSFSHAGTFNNNVLSMAGGLAGLTQVFTPEAAVRINALGDDLRQRLSDVAAKRGAPVQVTTDRSHKTQPAWSPDGRHLAFTVWNYDAQFWRMR